MADLQRVDDGLGRSMARSDEQLAFYVAQAREVIDLSLASQKQIVDDLQRIAGRHTAQASGLDDSDAATTPAPRCGPSSAT